MAIYSTIATSTNYIANQMAVMAATTCTSNTSVIWQTWAANSTSFTATSTWTTWNNAYEQSYVQVPPIPTVVPTLTPEQLAEAAERHRLAEEERQKRVAEIEAAKAKARETLISFLAEQQRSQFEKDGFFELSVDDRVYRIRPGARVEQLDPVTKNVLSQFCIHHSWQHALPEFDTALHQKLMLEADEKEFRRIANETRIAA